jgi:hypothetical protein
MSSSLFHKHKSFVHEQLRSFIHIIFYRKRGLHPPWICRTTKATPWYTTLPNLGATGLCIISFGTDKFGYILSRGGCSFGHWLGRSGVRKRYGSCALPPACLRHLPIGWKLLPLLPASSRGGGITLPWRGGQRPGAQSRGLGGAICGNRAPTGCHAAT